MRRVLLVAVLLTTGLALPATAQVRAPGGPVVQELTGGLAQPWEIVFLPEGGALVTERAGRVRAIDAGGRLLPAPLLEIAVGGGEGGLLGMALDPQYTANRFVYLYRTVTAPSLRNQVVRYRLEGGTLVEQQVIVDAIPAANTHNGGRIRFGTDGLLYVATGDAQIPQAAQNPVSLAGKFLRMPPAGYRAAGAGLEVFTLGHRNPQGIDFAGPLTYTTEHGPVGQDEVNRLVGGENYGWPTAVGANHPAPFRAPLALYSTIAPSGASFLRSGGSPWTGSFFVAALRGEQIRRLSLSCDQVIANEALFQGSFGRLRSVVEGPDGALYALTANGSNDRVLRIIPPAGVAPPPPDGSCGGSPPPSSGLPPPAAAEPPGGDSAAGALARLERISEVAAHDGVTAWSAWDAGIGAYRLMFRLRGQLGVPAPVPPRSVPFDVDLGPDARGRVTAVYSRCAREPTRHNAAGQLMRATGRGCDIYRLPVAGGREQQLSGPSTSSASEFLPSLWRGRIAFARVFERRPGLRGRVPYLYVSPVSGGRSQRQPGGARGSDGLPGPTSVSLRASRLSFAWDWRLGDRLRSELRLKTLGGPARLITRLGSRTRPATVLSPHVFGRHVFAGARRIGGGANASRILRYSLSGGRRRVARLRLGGELLVAARRDGDRLLIAAAEDPLAAPLCRSAQSSGTGPGCAVRDLPVPRFGR